MNASRPVLALSWPLFSSPMTHTWLSALSSCFYPVLALFIITMFSPILHSRLQLSSLLSTSFCLTFRMTSYLPVLSPFFLLYSFVLNPHWSWFWEVTFSCPVPTSLLHTDSWGPHSLGKLSLAKGSPLILPSYQQSREPREEGNLTAIVAPNCLLVRFECNQKDRSGCSLLWF